MVSWGDWTRDLGIYGHFPTHYAKQVSIAFERSFDQFRKTIRNRSKDDSKLIERPFDEFRKTFRRISKDDSKLIERPFDEFRKNFRHETARCCERSFDSKNNDAKDDSQNCENRFAELRKPIRKLAKVHSTNFERPFDEFRKTVRRTSNHDSNSHRNSFLHAPWVPLRGQNSAPHSGMEGGRDLKLETCHSPNIVMKTCILWAILSQPPLLRVLGGSASSPAGLGK